MAEAEKQQIELDLDNAEETEVEIDGVENPEVEASEASEDNFDKAKNKTQRRIDQLTKKMNESKRREDEAIRYAQNVQAEAKQLKERMETLDTSYVNEYTNRVETQMGTAEVDLARAMEIGDTNGVVEAQRKMTALAIENDRAQQAKMQQQRYAQQVQAQEQTQVQQPMPQQQPQPRRPDPKAEQWAQRNSWFGDDEAMTYAAFGVHKKLVENEGFDPQTEDYYTELDKRMQDEFPHKLKNGGSKRPAQTVASVSRSTSGRSSGKKVRLTPSQVAIAKKLGVPLEEYAKYVKE
tara:strand:- start:123 stop:1001 length:879 start_codon:yes stop_codon:yes gene_type:complete